MIKNKVDNKIIYINKDEVINIMKNIKNAMKDNKNMPLYDYQEKYGQDFLSNINMHINNTNNEEMQNIIFNTYTGILNSNINDTKVTPSSNEQVNFVYKWVNGKCCSGNINNAITRQEMDENINKVISIIFNKMPDIIRRISISKLDIKDKYLNEICDEYSIVKDTLHDLDIQCYKTEKNKYTTLSYTESIDDDLLSELRNVVQLKIDEMKQEFNSIGLDAKEEFEDNDDYFEFDLEIINDNDIAFKFNDIINILNKYCQSQSQKHYKYRYIEFSPYYSAR